MCAGQLLEYTTYDRNFLNSSTVGDKPAEETKAVASLTADDKAKEASADRWVSQASRCKNFEFVPYRYSVPDYLRVGLNLTIFSGHMGFSPWEITYIKNTARNICGIALAEGIAGHPAAGIQIADDLSTAVDPACRRGHFTKVDFSDHNFDLWLPAEEAKTAALRSATIIAAKYATPSEQGKANAEYANWESKTSDINAKQFADEKHEEKKS
jgi:hypothetical protein